MSISSFRMAGRFSPSASPSYVYPDAPPSPPSPGTITGALYTDADTFYAGVISGGSIAPDPGTPWLYTNSIAQHTGWDYILSTDPDAFQSVTYVGFLLKEMVNDPDGTPMQNAYVFRASFTDIPNTVELWMDQEFGSQAAAQVEVDKWTPRLGKLPRLYRRHLRYIICHHTDDVGFGADDLGHYFHGSDTRAAVRIANNDLEETFFHEATHAAIQKYRAADAPHIGFDYLHSQLWEDARDADNATPNKFVSKYAYDNQDTGEEMAENALFAYTMLLHPERIPEPDRTWIQNRIPNQIEFFRKIFFPRLLMADGTSSLLLTDGGRLLKEQPRDPGTVP